MDPTVAPCCTKIRNTLRILVKRMTARSPRPDPNAKRWSVPLGITSFGRMETMQSLAIGSALLQFTPMFYGNDSAYVPFHAVMQCGRMFLQVEVV